VRRNSSHFLSKRSGEDEDLYLNLDTDQLEAQAKVIAAHKQLEKDNIRLKAACEDLRCEVNTKTSKCMGLELRIEEASKIYTEWKDVVTVMTTAITQYQVNYT